NADLRDRINVLTDNVAKLSSELEQTKASLLEKSHALEDETGKFELLRHEVQSLQALVSQHGTELKTRTLELDFWKNRAIQERESFMTSLEKVEAVAHE